MVLARRRRGQWPASARTHSCLAIKLSQRRENELSWQFVNGQEQQICSTFLKHQGGTWFSLFSKWYIEVKKDMSGIQSNQSGWGSSSSRSSSFASLNKRHWDDSI